MWITRKIELFFVFVVRGILDCSKKKVVFPQIHSALTTFDVWEKSEKGEVIRGLVDVFGGYLMLV